MLFSSLIFLFVFLPIALLVYFIAPYKLKNSVLLLSSLVFFAWGGVSFTIILLISIAANYFFGLLLQKNINNKSCYRWLFAGVSFNLVLLGIFKYANFIISNINQVTKFFSIPPVYQTSILLPIGISFYTFHSVSYLVDIYRGKTQAQKNILDLALYICMFSQLIAGPIIRYSDVWQQLKLRTHSFTKFSIGIERFLIGLGKKVLLANTFAVVADKIFKSDVTHLSACNAWLGIVCYSLQIYCDFAGYSDMAIGLGKMFGFDFKENFNFPYSAKSVKEFWRRWHISLSTFFRDYVYIPLGGNKISEKRTYINLVLVFFLTGFWHGASWSFVVWGLFHGLFMVVERLGFEKVLEKLWSPLANLYTLLVVIFAWVLFRIDNFGDALQYWKAMFNFNSTAQQNALFASFLNRELYAALIIAILGCYGFYNFCTSYFKQKLIDSNNIVKPVYAIYHITSAVFLGIIFIMSCLYLIAGTYNPFIYYKF
jgi:alginate O-acetyltransferase complex protein AlgI